MNPKMGTLEAIFVSIIAGVILFFILPFFKKPRDRFTAWIKKKFTRKKKEKKVITADPNKEQKLQQLAQHKYNRGREEIDQDVRENIRNVMEQFSRKGILDSGMFLTKAIEIHTERIKRLLELRKSVNKEVFLGNKMVESNKDIDLVMQNLERIAEAQKTVIIGCERVIERQREKNIYNENMSWNIARLLSNIKRDLIIERDENLLLRKKE